VVKEIFFTKRRRNNDY